MFPNTALIFTFAVSSDIYKKMALSLGRIIRTAARPAAQSVRASASAFAVCASKRWMSTVDGESHDDFKPKKKAQPSPDDPKALFPAIEKVRLCSTNLASSSFRYLTYVKTKD